jgi:hypothetical protein
MKMKNYLFAFALLFLFSCEKDNPVIENEEELITTLTYKLTASDGTIVEGKFQDLDGDGGNAPTISNIVLKPNTMYSGSITLLNESVSPAEDITTEVEEEGSDHQFFFEATLANITVSYDDMDADNKAVGLKTKVVTEAASNGKLSITLKHKPNKSAMGVADGNIANAGGETDINVVFDVIIQ